MMTLLPRRGQTRPLRTLLFACVAGAVTLGIGAPAVLSAQVAPQHKQVETTSPFSTTRGQPAPAIARFETSARWAHEEDGTIYVRVTLSEPARGTLRVPFNVSGTATPGRDYIIDKSPLVFEHGDTSALIGIEIVDDGEDEPVETVLIALGAGGGTVGGTVGGTPPTAPPGTLVVGTGSTTVAIGPTKLGDPQLDLTLDQLAAFKRGKEVFQRRFKPSEGLGPFYNATSCASCHSTPAVGGTAELYRNFYLAVYQFGPTVNSQSPSIPPFLSQVVPAFGSGPQHSDALFTLTGGRPAIPETVLGFPVLSAQRNSIPIFGTGLFERVSNAEILSREDANDLNGDGISGRINTSLSGTALGRLGLKSQANNIELFTRGPLQNQMGITTDPFLGPDSIVSLPRAPFQVGADPNAPTVDNDGVPDPELGSQDLGDLIAFTRFLAPPLPKPFSPDALAGEALFASARCTDCHVPSLQTPYGPVNAYSDLLLHHMGTELEDKIKLGESPVAATDFRTQPLWGISLMAPYLHDGRASTLLDAIELHGGEATTSRNLFLGLTQTQRDQLIVFLEHL
jgi:CxxC motif-containing protein (DUF1111 family)